MNYKLSNIQKRLEEIPDAFYLHKCLEQTKEEMGV